MRALFETSFKRRRKSLSLIPFNLFSTHTDTKKAYHNQRVKAKL